MGLRSSSRQSCNLAAVHLAMPSRASCQARRCTSSGLVCVSTLRDTNSAQKNRGGSGFVQFVSGSALSGHAMPARFFRPASAQLCCGSSSSSSEWSTRRTSPCTTGASPQHSPGRTCTSTTLGLNIARMGPGSNVQFVLVLACVFHEIAPRSSGAISKWHQRHSVDISRGHTRFSHLCFSLGL